MKDGVYVEMEGTCPRAITTKRKKTKKRKNEEIEDVVFTEGSALGCGREEKGRKRVGGPKKSMGGRGMGRVKHQRGKESDGPRRRV